MTDATPDSSRVLRIGSAESCQVRLPNVAPVTAVAVLGSTQWILYTLHEDPIRCNGVPVHNRCEAHVGDVWEIGPNRFQVDLTGEPEAARASAAPAPHCRMIAEAGSHRLPVSCPEDALIGSAHDCDITLPAATGVAARHCLAAVSAGTWHLVDLTGIGGLRNGEPWSGLTELAHGDIVQLGPLRLSLSLTPRAITQTILNPSSRMGSEPPPRNASAPKPEPPKPPVSQPRAAPPGPVARPPVPSGPSRPAEPQPIPPAAHSAEAADASAPHESQRFDWATRKLAQELYLYLRSTHAARAVPSTDLRTALRWLQTLREARRAEELFVRGEQETAIRELTRLLEADPWNRSLLLVFSRMCDASGFDDLCLHVLRLMQVIWPADEVVGRALARLCQHLGGTDPRYLKQSAQLWERISLRSQTPEAIQATVRELVERHARRTS